MGGGLESRCVGRVYNADGAVHGQCVYSYDCTHNHYSQYCYQCKDQLQTVISLLQILTESLNL